MKYFLYFLCFFNFMWIQGQNDTINIDRPDQSEGTFVMKKNHFQMENGLSFSKQEINYNLMFRYGILKNTELRIETNLQKTQKNTHFDYFILSAKHKITEQKKFLPAITAVGYLNQNLPIKNNTSLDLTMAFEYDLTPTLSYGWNIGLNNRFKNWIFTTQFNYVPYDSFNFFIEYYANFQNKNNPEHNIDLGMMYFIHPKFVIDLVAGQRIFNSEKNIFIGGGFSYLFN